MDKIISTTRLAMATRHQVAARSALGDGSIHDARAPQIVSVALGSMQRISLSKKHPRSESFEVDAKYQPHFVGGLDQSCSSEDTTLATGNSLESTT
jgi:hypothetical protein